MKSISLKDMYDLKVAGKVLSTTHIKGVKKPSPPVEPPPPPLQEDPIKHIKQIVTQRDSTTLEIMHSVESVADTLSKVVEKIAFISTATTANGIGYFEMVADATLAATGCSFNNMGLFTFDSNSTITSCSFNSCGQIITGAADIVGCSVNQSTNSSAVLCASPAEAALITGCTFTSSGTGHAIEIGGTAANITLAGNIFTGYDTADPGTSTNKALFINIASGSMTITVSGGSGLSQTAVRTAGCSVTINSDVTVTFTGMKDNSEVRVYKTSDDSVVAGIEDATAGSSNNRSFAWSAPAGTDVYYKIHNFESGVPVYQTISKYGYIVPSTDTSIGVSQIIDRNAI